MAKNWIKKALPGSHRGRLHRALGVPAGKKIPKGRIAKAAGAGGALGKMARLAQTLAKLRGGGR